MSEHVDTLDLVDPSGIAGAEEAATAGHVVPHASFTKKMREDGWEILAL